MAKLLLLDGNSLTYRAFFALPTDMATASGQVTNAVFERLTAWLTPLLSFTTEEAWSVRHPDGGSNAMRTIPETPAAWSNPAEAARWGKIVEVLDVVTAALEIERREKRMGSALEAAPIVHVADAELLAAFDGVDPAEVFRTSQATLVAGEGPASAFRIPERGGVCLATAAISARVSRGVGRFTMAAA